jgi:hypothetical protein
VVTAWYDRRGLTRLQPEVLEHINQAVLAYMQSKRDASTAVADMGSDLSRQGADGMPERPE